MEAYAVQVTRDSGQLVISDPLKGKGEKNYREMI